MWAVIAPRVALAGFERLTATVSSSSSKVSFTTAILTFWEVTPGVKVSVPLASV